MVTMKITSLARMRRTIAIILLSSMTLSMNPFPMDLSSAIDLARYLISGHQRDHDVNLIKAVQDRLINHPGLKKDKTIDDKEVRALTDALIKSMPDDQNPLNKEKAAPKRAAMPMPQPAPAQHQQLGRKTDPIPEPYFVPMGMAAMTFRRGLQAPAAPRMAALLGAYAQRVGVSRPLTKTVDIPGFDIQVPPMPTPEEVAAKERAQRTLVLQKIRADQKDRLKSLEQGIDEELQRIGTIEKGWTAHIGKEGGIEQAHEYKRIAWDRLQHRKNILLARKKALSETQETHLALKDYTGDNLLVPIDERLQRAHATYALQDLKSFNGDALQHDQLAHALDVFNSTARNFTRNDPKNGYVQELLESVVDQTREIVTAVKQMQGHEPYEKLDAVEAQLQYIRRHIQGFDDYHKQFISKAEQFAAYRAQLIGAHHTDAQKLMQHQATLKQSGCTTQCVTTCNAQLSHESLRKKIAQNLKENFRITAIHETFRGNHPHVSRILHNKLTQGADNLFLQYFPVPYTFPVVGNAIQMEAHAECIDLINNVHQFNVHYGDQKQYEPFVSTMVFIAWTLNNCIQEGDIRLSWILSDVGQELLGCTLRFAHTNADIERNELAVPGTTNALAQLGSEFSHLADALILLGRGYRHASREEYCSPQFKGDFSGIYNALELDKKADQDAVSYYQEIIDTIGTGCIDPQLLEQAMVRAIRIDKSLRKLRIYKNTSGATFHNIMALVRQPTNDRFIKQIIEHAVMGALLKSLGSFGSLLTMCDDSIGRYSHSIDAKTAAKDPQLQAFVNDTSTKTRELAATVKEQRATTARRFITAQCCALMPTATQYKKMELPKAGSKDKQPPLMEFLESHYRPEDIAIITYRDDMLKAMQHSRKFDAQWAWRAPGTLGRIIEEYNVIVDALEKESKARKSSMRSELYTSLSRELETSKTQLRTLIDAVTKGMRIIRINPRELVTTDIQARLKAVNRQVAEYNNQHATQNIDLASHAASTKTAVAVRDRSTAVPAASEKTMALMHHPVYAPAASVAAKANEYEVPSSWQQTYETDVGKVEVKMIDAYHLVAKFVDGPAAKKKDATIGGSASAASKGSGHGKAGNTISIAAMLPDYNFEVLDVRAIQPPPKVVFPGGAASKAAAAMQKYKVHYNTTCRNMLLLFHNDRQAEIQRLLQQPHEATEKKLKALEQELVSLNLRLHADMSSLAQLNKDYFGNQDIFPFNTSRVQQLEKDVRGLVDEDNKKRFYTWSANVIANQTSKKYLENAIRSHQEVLKTFDDAIKVHQSKYIAAAATTSTRGMRATLPQLQERIAKNQKAIDDKTPVVNKLRADIQEKEGDLESLRSEETMMELDVLRHNAHNQELELFRDQIASSQLRDQLDYVNLVTEQSTKIQSKELEHIKLYYDKQEDVPKEDQDLVAAINKTIKENGALKYSASANFTEPAKKLLADCEIGLDAFANLTACNETQKYIYLEAVDLVNDAIAAKIDPKHANVVQGPLCAVAYSCEASVDAVRAGEIQVAIDCLRFGRIAWGFVKGVGKGAFSAALHGKLAKLLPAYQVYNKLKLGAQIYDVCTNPQTRAALSIVFQKIRELPEEQQAEFLGEFLAGFLGESTNPITICMNIASKNKAFQGLITTLTAAATNMARPVVLAGQLQFAVLNADLVNVFGVTFNRRLAPEIDRLFRAEAITDATMLKNYLRLWGVGFSDLNPVPQIIGPGAGNLRAPTQLMQDIWDMSPHGRIIYGRYYTIHALERMAPTTDAVIKELKRRALALGYIPGSKDFNDYILTRNIPPSVIENAIRTGTRTPGKYAGTWQYVFENVKVFTNDTGDVTSVYRTSR